MLIGRISSLAGFVALVTMGSCALAATSDPDPLGVYLGAAAGWSDLRNPNGTYPATYPETFQAHATAWKAYVGVRPLSFAGLELGFDNLGDANSQATVVVLGNHVVNTYSKQSAATLFGVGFLPLPLSMVDLYGKLGVARLHTISQPPPPPVCFLLVCTLSRQNTWSSDLAYGAGVQLRFAKLAIRGEYERISASGGNPDMYSLGINWTF